MPRKYTKTGLTPLLTRLRVRGMEGIDRRYGAARASKAIRSAHEDALGGPEAMSPMQHNVLSVLVSDSLAWSAYARVIHEHRDQLKPGKRRLPEGYVEQYMRLGAQVVRHTQVLLTLPKPGARRCPRSTRTSASGTARRSACASRASRTTHRRWLRNQ